MDGSDDQHTADADNGAPPRGQSTVELPDGQPPSAQEPVRPQGDNRAPDDRAPDGEPSVGREDMDRWEYDDPPPVQTGDETPPTA